MAEGRGDLIADAAARAMAIAIDEARAAAARGEVPVGAVVLDAAGAILARAGNQTEASFDPTAHAELLALRHAAVLRCAPRLPDCDLVVTLEPCPMCAAAIGFFRIRRVIFGAYDIKAGGIEHGPRIFDAPGAAFRPEVVGGIRQTECAVLLSRFFATRRSVPNPRAAGLEKRVGLDDDSLGACSSSSESWF